MMAKDIAAVFLGVISVRGVMPLTNMFFKKEVIYK